MGMAQSLCDFKAVDEDLEIEFEVLQKDDLHNDPRYASIQNEIQNLDFGLQKDEEKLAALNKEIDNLTNHADKLDYVIAVASGITCGLIDSFFVGAFSFDAGSQWGKDKVDSFVVKIAQMKGYKGDDLAGAVKYLEGNFPMAADKATNDFGGGLNHHLRDFSHHGSISGLFFSMLTQFTGKAYGTDRKGMFKIVDVSNSGLIGESFPAKIFLGTVQWFFHMVSDIAGSSGSIMRSSVGTGVPGPILSLAKELSVLPIFKHGEGSVSETISKLFNGTFLGDHDANGKIIPGTTRPFDLRAELGVLQQLGKQAIPVIINECIVRGFYFVRRLHGEIKAKNVRSFDDFLHKIEWNNVLPWKNRTIVRMLTIATGTFTAVDMIDAAIRSAAKTGATPAFWASFVMHVNFVGVGRFVLAAGTDIKMGIKKSGLEQDRRILYNVMLQRSAAKIYYKQAEVWIAAEDAEMAIQHLQQQAVSSVQEWNKQLRELKEDLDAIKEIDMSEVDKKNPGLRNMFDD